MKKIAYLIILTLTSCATSKNMIYFSDAEISKPQDITQEYDSRIQNDDRLYITVTSKNPELAVPFNPELLSKAINGVTNVTIDYSSYLVDSKGEIVFPILGVIPVVGLTNMELASVIEKLIVDGNYINDPTVTVKLINYKVSVLGEVKTPGLKKIESERVTILDAIGLAGDLTIYGVRENVSIIREINGKREVAIVDISSKELFNSPYYYLRPNDIIYVQPNKKQQRLSKLDTYVLSASLSAASVFLSMLSLIIR